MVHLLALRRVELHLSNSVLRKSRVQYPALPGLVSLTPRAERESRRGGNQYGRRKFGQETGQTRRRWIGKRSAGAGRSRTALEADGLHLLERRRLEFRGTRLGMVHLLALRSARLH